MAQSSKAKKKKDQPDIHVEGSVIGSNIVIGNNNNISFQEAAKTEYTLFTIPLPVTDFTGREKELAQLKESFTNGAVITGMSGGGGVGKTELARKLAQEIADDYPNARMSIDLRGTSENPLAPEEVMRRILEPFYPNQKLPDEPEQLKGLYQQTFSVQKALLLLDNAASAVQVRPLIPPAPSAAIITSRQHFSLTEFGLSEPLRLDVLSFEESRELLRTASPKLKESRDEEVDALSQICGRLPLALRVAASILNDRADWTLASLLKRLGDEHTRLQRLKREGDIDLDVEAVLGLSYELLDKELKKNFRILGLFTAPFINISAQALWQIEDMEEVDQWIGKLTSLSLLNILPSPFGTGQDGETIYLYALHDLTRLFAINQLLKDEEEAGQSILLHANHFLGWASEADVLYQKGNENILLGLAQFRFIWQHLYSAYERLLPERNTLPRQQIADRWLIQFPYKCLRPLELHITPRERINIFQNTLQAAKRLGNKKSEGSNLGNMGNAYFDLGELQKAMDYYKQALAIALEIRDRIDESASLGNIGKTYCELGLNQKAIKYIERALIIDREIGDPRDELADLNNLGTIYFDLGNMEKAFEQYNNALKISREIGDKLTESYLLSNMGNIYNNLGDGHKAIKYHEFSLSITQQIGDRKSQSLSLGNIGLAYQTLGDIPKAIEYFEKALTVNREIGNNSDEGGILNNIGIAYSTLNNTIKAIEFFEKAIGIARKFDNRKKEGEFLGNLGRVYKILGEKEKAKRVWQEAIKVSRTNEASANVATLEKLLTELDGDQTEEKSEISVQDFIHMVFQAVRSKNPQAQQLFDQLSKMKSDTNLSIEEQELAKVLWHFMAGIKKPDLSRLPEEFAKVVKEELEK